MRSLFYSHTTGWFGSLALLLLRLVMGTAFLIHGWGKIQDPMGWMGAGAAVPGMLQLLAAVAEFGGGAALILGLLTRLASLGIAAVMVTAIALVHGPAGDPFVNPTGGRSFEQAATYLVCAIVFFILGPGRYSLDALLFRRRREPKPRAG